MRCKKIQEFILTDYLDDQMNEKQKLSIDQHLAGCQKCERFFMYVRKNIAGLFTNEQKQVPSEIVWQKIKESLVARERKKPVFVIGFFDRLKSALYIPKPAIIFVSAVTFVLAVSLMGALYIGNQKRLNYSDQETIQDIDYYKEPLSDVYSIDNAGLGTAIEENFL